MTSRFNAPVRTSDVRKLFDAEGQTADVIPNLDVLFAIHLAVINDQAIVLRPFHRDRPLKESETLNWM